MSTHLRPVVRVAFWGLVTSLTVSAQHRIAQPVWAAEPNRSEGGEVAHVVIDEETIDELVEQAIVEFQPLESFEVDEARAELETSLQRLENFVNSSDTVAQSQDWSELLALQQLREVVDSDLIDLRELASIRSRFFEDIEGLELEVFLNVRDRIDHLINTSFYAEKPDLEQDYVRYLDLLKEQVTEIERQPQSRREASWRAGRTLGWLAASGRAPQVIRAIRRNYSRPNLHMSISEAFLTSGLMDEVNQEERIVENILGTKTYADVSTNGHVRIDLIENNERAQFKLLFEGISNSRNIGYNGPVKIYSRGTTNFFASRTVFLDQNGLEYQPTVASSRMRTRVTNVCAKPLIVAIAQKRIRRDKCKAENIASGRAATRLRRRVDEKSSEEFQEMRRNMETRVSNPLIRLGEFPEQIHLTTTDQRLLVEATKAGRYQLAAPATWSSALKASDFNVQVHESFLNNFAESFLAGRTVADSDVVELLQKFSGWVPETLQAEDRDPWAITFPVAKPITFEFDEDQLTINIIARRLRSGDQSTQKSMRISATYEIERGEEFARLHRAGEVEVEYLRPSSTVRDTTFQSTVKNRFDKVFEEYIDVEAVRIFERYDDIETIKLEDAESSDGWMALAWELVATQKMAH